MKVLYIGIYDEGSTSKMRGEAIKTILNPSSFEVINTSNVSINISKIWLSIGWRFKIGPLIWKINKIIYNSILTTYDLIWIDKGVFIHPKTVQYLKTKTEKLIYYTPDTTFYGNISEKFNKSIPYYDFIITTKSFELNIFKQMGCKKLIYVTQGYDPNVHINQFPFSQKRGVVFIGLYEKERANIIEFLLNNSIQIKLGGPGWENFYSKHKNFKNLTYYSNTLYGSKYSEVLSSSLFGLGFLSKKFPEQHTTRTFEIPACGTALLSEENIEIKEYFTNSDIIFYHSNKELLEKIKMFSIRLNLLEEITKNGYKKVKENKLDYNSIIGKILNDVLN